jgi:Cu2+-exporting ATPase
MSKICFHCHQAVPSSLNLTLEWDGARRSFCCLGCYSVAEAIINNGLDDYYKFRTQVSVKPDELVPQELRDIELMDDSSIQQHFVHEAQTISKAELGVDGITCAACSWLIETRLLKEPGITSVAVNPLTHRLTLRWDQSQTPLSHILKLLLSLGYKAYPFQHNQREQHLKRENRNYLIRLGVAGLGMMQVMMFALGLYLGDANDIARNHQNFLHWVSGIVATPIVVYSAFPFFRNAWYGLKARHLVMDVPVVIAISLAYAASVWATLTEQGQVYFDSVSMFIFFLLLGRYLEHRVRVKAMTATQTQRQYLPVSVTAIRERQQVDLPLSKVSPGDQLLIRPGETIAVDGKVIEGESYVNESLLTGESQPVSKTVGDSLLAGTINESQPLIMSVTAVGEGTYFSALQRMSEEASEHKPPLALLADRIAHWFVLGILFIVALVYAIWWFYDPNKAFWIALSVLVVSCPCALSLATPAALTTATHRLSQLGVLVLRSHTLQSLSNINLAVFDKTGTLTEGQLELTDIQIIGSHSKQELLDIACALERSQTHPIARAFSRLDTQQLTLQQVTQHPGQGVSGRLNHHLWQLGKPDFCGLKHFADDPDQLQVALSCDGQLQALFTLQDTVKPDAPDVIRSLHSLNIPTVLLSGDAQSRVVHFAKQLGLGEAYGNQLPHQKAERIRQWQSQGKKVLMVGDGLNDSLVLAAADVGIAIDTAADITQLNADAVLTHQRLTELVSAIKLARATESKIKQNLIWALIYNVSAIPLAALGWIPPWLAAIGMTASSLIVVLNALRLKRVV